MYKNYYKIGGIVIEVDSTFPFYVANGVDFLCDPTTPDYRFQFEQVNDIPKLMDGFQKVGETMWSHEYQNEAGVFLRAFLWKDKYYSEISILGKEEGVCYYASADILMERAKEGFELLMYLCIEKILIQFGGLVLHSSHIKIDGKGLVFSAPSQVGKSTQAELWKKYANADIINGDRSVLRKIGGQWYVFGCPMCGTSGIHIQSSEPLSNIIMLAQNQTNILKKLSIREAFHMLYPQITVAYWDTAYIDKIMKLLEDLLIEIPVWFYACTKEYEAVTVLKDTLNI